MRTAPIATPLLFNAIDGQELKEVILREIRKNFDQDERFRQHHTFPRVSYKFMLSMKYEPGMAQAVNLAGNVDARSKIQAQQDLIERLRKDAAAQDEKFLEIESQAGLMISDLEKTKRDLADANEFIKKLMAEKNALVNNLNPERTEPVFDLDSLVKGEPMVVEHESAPIEEPDRLRESGETLSPEAFEVTMEGGGEASGEEIPQMAVVGRQPTEVQHVDPALKLPTSGTGATVGERRGSPSGVKGRPRE